MPFAVDVHGTTSRTTLSPPHAYKKIRVQTLRQHDSIAVRTKLFPQNVKQQSLQATQSKRQKQNSKTDCVVM